VRFGTLGSRGAKYIVVELVLFGAFVEPAHDVRRKEMDRSCGREGVVVGRETS
jgi:hypothetical protein